MLATVPFQSCQARVLRQSEDLAASADPFATQAKPDAEPTLLELHASAVEPSGPEHEPVALEAELAVPESEPPTPDALPASALIPYTVVPVATGPSLVVSDGAEVQQSLEPKARTRFIPCSSELQLVMCGGIPRTSWLQRRECCWRHRPLPVTPQVAEAAAAADTEAVEIAQTTTRADLSGSLSTPPAFNYTCLGRAVAMLPSFVGTNNGRTVNQTAPILTSATINRIKSNALNALRRNSATAPILNTWSSLRRVNATSGLVHPASPAGPAELALLQWRLSTNTATTTTALDSLLRGTGVPIKWYGSWRANVDTPLDYSGPYVLSNMSVKWSGLQSTGVPCPANFPASGPRGECGHVSFVELDGQQAFKQAMAYWATNDTRYADIAQRIVEQWSLGNRAFGILNQNGPLEAAWGVSSMAKALELLRYKPWPGYKPAVVDSFVSWVEATSIPQFNWYIRGNTFYSNWHASIGEALMSYALLTNNRTRYDESKVVFSRTINDYLKWGKGSWAENRIVGECTETLRDIFHSEVRRGAEAGAGVAWAELLACLLTVTELD
jgi:hypothetical protein